MANIIMVPRPSDPIMNVQNVPVTFNHHQHQRPYGVPQEVDMMIKSIQASVSVPMMGGGMGHDPWHDYRLFHQPDLRVEEYGQEMHVQFHEIDMRFWSRADFRDTLLDVNETILVQPTHSGWRIGFESLASRTVFYDQFYSTIKQHNQTVECTFEQWTAMSAWVEANIVGPKIITHSQRGSDVTVNALIKDHQEAMHFKLRWYNIKEVEASLEEQE